MSPSPHDLRRSSAALLSLLAVLLVGACGGSEPADRDLSEELADRARAGLEARYVATYTLETADAADSTVRVSREPLRIRVDVETETGVATSIRDADGTVACQEALDGRTTCLVVAGPGEDSDPAFDPSLRRVFGSVLEVFAERSEELTLAEVDATDLGPVVEDADPRCFRVSDGPPEPVTAGTYCLTDEGVPARIVYENSAATLTELAGPADPATFVPPVTPTQVPIPES